MKLGKMAGGMVIALLICLPGLAQQDWPKVITAANGDIIKVYQPQCESFVNDMLKARAAVSVVEKGKTEPVFGAIWVVATMKTNRQTRIVVLTKLLVSNVKWPGQVDSSKIQNLKSTLEKEIPAWNITLPLDELLASLEDSGVGSGAGSDSLSTTPPTILYSDKPSILVLLDGEPKWKENKEMGLDLVINTPFTMVRDKTGKLYLNGGKRWYSAYGFAGPWVYEKSIPKSLTKIDQAIKENEAKQGESVPDSLNQVIPQVVVSTKPAELIQSNGEANFATLPGSALLYMTNTNNDLFKDIASQLYFVLLSGRWYSAASLNGPWTYVASERLPADFAKIPDSSAKSNILASVAGTADARDAVLDAMVPQTARVDRQSATAKVEYDGEPKFLAIEGTNLSYAVNTSSTVLLSGGQYYCVENGVWFESKAPKGPWTVATSRPTDVSKIPASNPTYSVKYVYVYEVTPQYVYMGYTPGYTGTYVLGPTVVYGTGFYYNPWYGPYYYPRPYTYGFSMHYNPWMGWSVGFHYSTGWFSMGVYVGGYHGGYWGPPYYRPPYYRPPYYPPYYRPPYYPPPGYRPPPPGYRPPGQGQYPGRPTPYDGNKMNANRANNIYNNQKGVSTMDKVRPMPADRPAQQPGTNNRLPAGQTKPGNANNVLVDKQGNVYQKNGNDWQQRGTNNWQGVDKSRQNDINALNRQQQMRDRGATKTNDFNQTNRASRPAQQNTSKPAPRGSAPSGTGRR
jgi:hypothetical protein